MEAGGSGDDAEAVTVAPTTADSSPKLSPSRTRQSGAAAAGVDDEKLKKSRAFPGFNGYLSSAVLDRVADQVVQRLSELDLVADYARIKRPPTQPQAPAAKPHRQLPAFDGSLDQRPERNRVNRCRSRAAVDLPVESLKRGGRDVEGGFADFPLSPTSRQGERKHLQGAAQLVHRLVQRGPPTALTQTRNSACYRQ
jgi:hypothetical protein